MHVCEVMCAPARVCMCTACLVSMAGGVGPPGDPGAGGETRGSAPMLEPRAGCPAGWAGWASPFRAACETSVRGPLPARGERVGVLGGPLASPFPAWWGGRGWEKKTHLTLPGPGGGHSPGGGLGLGPWPDGPCGVMKFGKSSAIETLLPVFEGSRLGHLRLASCAFSAVATWGGRNSGGGEEIQISLVPCLFPRIVMLIIDQFHSLLKNKLL